MADYFEESRPDPKSGDILQLLEGLQYGDLGSPKENLRSYSRKPNENPGADPRAQAIQQYMEMQGAGSIPRLPFKVPDAKGRLGKPTIKQRMDMFGDLDDRETDPHSGVDDTNQFFRDADNPPRVADDYKDAQGRSDPGLAPDQSNMTDDEDAAARMEMKLPTYVDRRGKPSPNKAFDTEGELAGISKKIEGIQEFDPGELEQAQKDLRDSPTDTMMFNFTRKYGRKNLPDFGPAPTDEETQYKQGIGGNQEGLQGMPLDELRRLYLFKKQQRGEQLTDEELLQMIEPKMEQEPTPPTPDLPPAQNPLPYRPPVRGQEMMPKATPEIDELSRQLRQRIFRQDI